VRKLTVFLLVLGLLALGADVLARRTAEEQIAGRLQDAFDLESEPDVSIEGMPFLVDLLKGEISTIEMASRNVRTEAITLDEVTLDLRGVRFSLDDVIDGSGRVTARRGEGSATITERNLNEALAAAGAPFTVTLDSEGLTATSESAGIEASVDPSIEGNELSLNAEGLGSVPVQLPNLGGRVTYESVALADGSALLDLSVGRLVLEG
jgi:hypothetical protein